MKAKAALDHKGFETLYPVYSMSILWNLDYAEISADVVYGISEGTPFDGDAASRARYQELRLADAWTKLEAAQLSRIRNNHHTIDRNNR